MKVASSFIATCALIISLSHKCLGKDNTEGVTIGSFPKRILADGTHCKSDIERKCFRPCKEKCFGEDLGSQSSRDCKNRCRNKCCNVLDQTKVNETSVELLSSGSLPKLKLAEATEMIVSPDIHEEEDADSESIMIESDGDTHGNGSGRRLPAVHCSCTGHRCVAFYISNRTKKPMRFLGVQRNNGNGYRFPTYIGAGHNACGIVYSGWLRTAKITGLYQWGSNSRERVALFMENPHSGGNTHGIKYYWNTFNSMKWYQDNVPEYRAGNWLSTLINGWFTVQSNVSGGNHATAYFNLIT